MSSGDPQSEIGVIVWTDLTVENAAEVRDFYGEVAGWSFSPLDMGGYDDYVVLSPQSGRAIGGVCHSRGSNANLPPQWLIYIRVKDMDTSVQRCVELGGKLIDGPREMGEETCCVIQDPAGAVCALIS